MALPVTFGPLVAAQMSQLDQDFAAVGALTTLQCGATGTNAIVLTPVANQPVVTAYGLPFPIKFGFAAAATSTGTVTLEVGTLGFLPVYTPNGVQAASGTLVTGNYYEVTFSTASLYNSGNGAWVLSSYQPSTGLVVLAGSSARGLKVTNNSGTPNTQIDISFQQACLVNASGTPAFFGILAATIDLTTGTVTPTANGMDGESRPASGWVHVYAISTGSGMAGLGTTTSPLSGPPTLPAGYSYYAYLGAMRCDASSNLLRTRQLGPETQYAITAATNTAVFPAMVSGLAGTALSTTTATYGAVAVGSFVPPTASKIKAQVINNGFAALAANASYVGTGTNPAPLAMQPLNSISVGVAEIILESTNIYVAGNSGNPSVYAVGWTDYVSAAG